MFTTFAVRKNSPSQRTTFDLGRHRLRQITLRDRADHARHFTRRLNKIANEIVDRPDRIRPRIRNVPERCALRNFTLFANQPANSLQFLRHPLVCRDHVVECVRDLAGQACPVIGQTRRKIAALECGQRREQLPVINLAVDEGRAIIRPRH